MHSDQRWRIVITNLVTSRSIGIHAHEKTPQRVWLSAVIEGYYALKPESVEECINYERIYDFIMKEWSSRPHTDLLETCVAELLEFIFHSDRKVEFAKVSLSKPDIFKEAESVGVEAEWTRADFERHKNA